MTVAKALSARNVEVLAIDIDEDRIRTAAPHVTEAVCFDATDETALARTYPDRRDVCLCSIGYDAKEASIICTALLKQMGAKKVIARSDDDLHARILRLVGADLVVNPEREFGERFANQILHERIRGEMLLGEGVLITELAIPKAFENQSLGGLRLPNRYGVTVVAIRKGDTGEVLMPSPDLKLTTGDVMVIVAKEEAVTKMIDES